MIVLRVPGSDRDLRVALRWVVADEKRRMRTHPHLAEKRVKELQAACLLADGVSPRYIGELLRLSTANPSATARNYAYRGSWLVAVIAYEMFLQVQKPE